MLKRSVYVRLLWVISLTKTRYTGLQLDFYPFKVAALLSRQRPAAILIETDFQLDRATQHDKAKIEPGSSSAVHLTKSLRVMSIPLKTIQINTEETLYKMRLRT